MNIWQCPNPREFMDEICGILELAQRHLVIYLPQYRLKGFAESFNAYCRKYHGELIHIIPDAQTSPAECLRQCFEDGDSLTVETFATGKPYRENILLELPDNLDEDMLEKWGNFFDELCSSAKQFIDFGRPLPWRVLALVPSHLPSLKPDSNLEIFLGSGLFRASDLEYAIEKNLEESGIRTRSSKIWLTAICQGLGRADPELCNAIFDALPIEWTEILHLLENYSLGHLDNGLKNMVIAMDDSGNDINHANVDQLLLHDYGIMEPDTEGKDRLHPAALAWARRPQAIERLVVQGQIRVYLPMAQEVHTFICRRLQKLCGDGWHKRGDGTHHNLEIDIGPLCHYMNTCLKGQCGDALLDLAWSWRAVRHKLAHGNMIDYNEARQAVELYDDLEGGNSW